MSQDWHLKLFRKSVLKQAKLRELKEALGPLRDEECLDLGGDNGVISYLLREHGGNWSSGDLTPNVCDAIRSLVKERVSLVSGDALPYDDDGFDVVAVVDMLEHVEDDVLFKKELCRILKRGGRLVINAPNTKRGSLLRMFRHLIGQTDEAHGHLRPGYNARQLRALFGDEFELISTKTYSKFFSEFVDTVIVGGFSVLQKIVGGKKSAGEKDNGKEKEVSKGLVVTESDLKKFKKMFTLYSLIYPVMKAMSVLDVLVPFEGYMRISVLKKRAG